MDQFPTGDLDQFPSGASTPPTATTGGDQATHRQPRKPAQPDAVGSPEHGSIDRDVWARRRPDDPRRDEETSEKEARREADGRSDQPNPDDSSRTLVRGWRVWMGKFLEKRPEPMNPPDPNYRGPGPFRAHPLPGRDVWLSCARRSAGPTPRSRPQPHHRERRRPQKCPSPDKRPHTDRTRGCSPRRSRGRTRSRSSGTPRCRTVRCPRRLRRSSRRPRTNPPRRDWRCCPCPWRHLPQGTGRTDTIHRCSTGQRPRGVGE